MAFSSGMKKSKCVNNPCTYRYEAFHVLGKAPFVQPAAADLFCSLRFFMIVGRLLGVLPYSGIFKKSYKHLQFCPKSSAAIISYTILILISINLIFGIIDTFHQPKRNALEIAKSVRETVQFFWSWLIYSNFLIRGKKFLALFHKWATTSMFYSAEDRHLKRDVIFITLLVMTSAILENAVLNLEYIEALDHISGYRFENSAFPNKSSMSFLETYYRRSHDNWSSVIGFHEIFAVVAFLQHKCMLYGCNFLDITLAVFSRAIYFKFKTLYKLGHDQLAKPLRSGATHSTGNKTRDRQAWARLVQDHKKLCDLLSHFETFFSPLVFGSYVVSIYYICIQLFDGLTTDMSTNSLTHSIYAPWSFLHVIMRVYIVSICAARINVYAHRIGNVLQECPIEYYNDEVARVDKKVTTGPDIGLTGLGCFIVTKPFILRIISVVFTFEIVLLQGVPSASVLEDC